MGAGDTQDEPGEAGEHRPAQFEPLRPATPAVRTAVLLGGSLLWTAMLIALAVAAHRANAVAIALLILATTILISVAYLVPSRRRAIREDEES